MKENQEGVGGGVGVEEADRTEEKSGVKTRGNFCDFIIGILQTNMAGAGSSSTVTTTDFMQLQ